MSPEFVLAGDIGKDRQRRSHGIDACWIPVCSAASGAVHRLTGAFPFMPFEHSVAWYCILGAPIA